MEIKNEMTLIKLAPVQAVRLYFFIKHSGGVYEGTLEELKTGTNTSKPTLINAITWLLDFNVISSTYKKSGRKCRELRINDEQDWK